MSVSAIFVLKHTDGHKELFNCKKKLIDTAFLVGKRIALIINATC